MVDLQPFEAATNRTAVLCARKGQATTYPVPYLKWRKRAKSRIELRDSLADVQKATERFSLAAEPISDSTSSPWLVAYPQALKVLRKIAGPSAYRAFAGACGWLNGVFWIDIVKNVGKLVRVEALFSRHFSDTAPHVGHFFANRTALPVPRVSLPAPAAPRSAATCRRTAAGLDVLPPAGASSTWHASRAGPRSSPAAAGDS